MAAVAVRDSPVLESRSVAGHPSIVFEHVSLAFDGKAVLRDISFDLLPGHTKIILGASGSGKSTILKLILGLLKPDSGACLLYTSPSPRDPKTSRMPSSA